MGKDSSIVFNQLKTSLSKELEKVNILLMSMAKDHDVNLIENIAKHIMSAGGKRIRPLVCLASAGLFSPKNDNHIYLATSVECIHTATLLHDDVIDESDSRRGMKTANHIWGDKASILVGDFLFSQAFRLMVKTNLLSALERLSHASSVIAESEVSQLEQLGNINFSLDLYLKLINSKTASLFSTSAAVGAIAGGASEKEIEICDKYGESLGMCFQIIDDILDYTGDDNFGKVPGNDFYEGKVTAPMIFALQNADSKYKEEIVTLFEDRENEASFIKMKNLLMELGGFTEAYSLAEQYCNKGIEYLNMLPNSSLKKHLSDLIYFTASRDY